MSETATITVKSIELDGDFHRLVDGNDVAYATKKDDVIPSEDLVGKQVEIEFKVYKKTKGDRTYTNRYLEAVKVLGSNGDTPPLGTGEYVKGQTAPSDARRILGCVAWEHAVKLADVEMRHTVGREITPAMVLDAAQHYANQIFLDLLRKGRMMEDSDIPL